jgi:2-polyprenyl-3-methyl-5-hydroxy-6-metoxy-1,4-benzoquinol methylase
MIKNFKLKKNNFGFYQVNPQPNSEEIAKFYSEEFYTNDYKNFNDSSLEVQIKDKDFFEGKWNDIYNNFLEIDKSLGNKASILDIGCGWGQALLFFKEKGFDCYGFDPVIEAVAYGCKKGLKIKQTGFEGMDVFEGKKFNIVTMLNVLEHLPEPTKALQQVKEILKPNGILLIDVPNDFNDFQIAARDTHALNDWWVSPPNHLNYFSKNSLVNLLKFLGFSINICESSFPLEIFLLFGENYVKDKNLGSLCHKKRVLFEQNLRKQGKTVILKNFYRSLAELNLGRQISIYCTLK